jgi:hypothetical protein
MCSLRIPGGRASNGGWHRGLKSLRENWVLYQGTTLVVPQLLENIAGL